MHAHTNAVGDIHVSSCRLRSSKDEDQLTGTLQHPILPGQYKQTASGLQYSSSRTASLIQKPALPCGHGAAFQVVHV